MAAASLGCCKCWGADLFPALRLTDAQLYLHLVFSALLLPNKQLLITFTRWF